MATTVCTGIAMSQPGSFFEFNGEFTGFVCFSARGAAALHDLPGQRLPGDGQHHLFSGRTSSPV